MHETVESVSSHVIDYSLKNKYLILNIKTGILTIEKRFVYMSKMAYKLAHIRLMC